MDECVFTMLPAELLQQIADCLSSSRDYWRLANTCVTLRHALINARENMQTYPSWRYGGEKFGVCTMIETPERSRLFRDFESKLRLARVMSIPLKLLRLPVPLATISCEYDHSMRASSQLMVRHSDHAGRLQLRCMPSSLSRNWDRDGLLVKWPLGGPWSSPISYFSLELLDVSCTDTLTLTGLPYLKTVRVVGCAQVVIAKCARLTKVITVAGETKLKVEACARLAAVDAGGVTDLELIKCPGLVHFDAPRLACLTLNGCDGLELVDGRTATEVKVTGCALLRALFMTRVKNVFVSKCPRLATMCFGRNLACGKQFKFFHLEQLPSLRWLSSDVEASALSIIDCPLLEAVDFPNVRGMIEVVGATRVSRLSFPLVTMVNLKDCSPALSSLQVPGADWLTLVSCPGLEVVSTSHHMKKLKVEDCGQLDLSDLPEPVTQRSK